MVKVLVPIADGSEDIETACITDVLVRGGVEVTTASVMSCKTVTFARGLKVTADILVSELAVDVPSAVAAFDAVVLPGGMPGAEHFKNSDALQSIITAMYTTRPSTIIGAICAAPYVALGANAVVMAERARMTCFPALKDKFTAAHPNVVYDDASPVVLDGRVITSQGPGTAVEFAFVLVSKLIGVDKAMEVAKAMLVKFPCETAGAQL
eukprot:PhM_4_TR9107/c0_g1_i1/m.83617/K03152/thiJ; protein deglycase